jgi:hypothetical protein
MRAEEKTSARIEECLLSTPGGRALLTSVKQSRCLGPMAKPRCSVWEFQRGRSNCPPSPTPGSRESRPRRGFLRAGAGEAPVSGGLHAKLQRVEEQREGMRGGETRRGGGAKGSCLCSLSGRQSLGTAIGPPRFAPSLKGVPTDRQMVPRERQNVAQRSRRVVDRQGRLALVRLAHYLFEGITSSLATCCRSRYKDSSHADGRS